MKPKNNIRLLRVERSLSQEELAKTMHVHQTAVSQWENGKNSPEMQQALELANFFEVSVDYLLGRTDERTNSFYANNIRDSNFVQGNGSVSVGSDVKISKEEAELLRVYRILGVRGRAKLMNFVFDLEDEIKKNQENINETVTIFEAARGTDVEPGMAQISKETINKLKEAPKVDKI